MDCEIAAHDIKKQNDLKKAELERNHEQINCLGLRIEQIDMNIHETLAKLHACGDTKNQMQYEMTAMDK